MSLDRSSASSTGDCAISLTVYAKMPIDPRWCAIYLAL
jgi:hypothetical protein